MWDKRYLRLISSLTSDVLLLLLVLSQTIALWLRNTNYREEQKDCFGVIQSAADENHVKLFQRKSVFEMLWGYNDSMLAALVVASKLPFPFPQCPGPEGGLTDFVQMQVCQIVHLTN